MLSARVCVPRGDRPASLAHICPNHTQLGRVPKISKKIQRIHLNRFNISSERERLQGSPLSWQHLLETGKTRHSVRLFKVMSNDYRSKNNETSSHK